MTPPARRPQRAGVAAGWPCPVPLVLSPTRRGPGDPTFRRTADGAIWRGIRTPGGAGHPAPASPTRRRAPSPPRPGGAAPSWVAGPAAADARRRRRPDRLRARRSRWQDAWRRHRHWRIGATGLVMESLVPAIIEQKVTGQEAFAGFRRAGPPVRRAGARAAERARARRAAVGAALARGAAGGPVVGVAAAARRRRPVAPDPARGPGRDGAGAGRSRDARWSSTGGCARCPGSGCGPARRCARGRSATPTRSASATTTSPRTSAGC